MYSRLLIQCLDKKISRLYHLNTMRKFIEKINSWIQWTKQWHFFHVFFCTAFLIFSWNAVFYILGGAIEILHDTFCFFFDSNCVKSDLEFGTSFFAFAPLQILGLIFSSICGIILGIIVECINYAIKRTTNVQSDFLLNNKFYQTLYVIEVYAFITSFVLLFIMLLPEIFIKIIG